MSLKSSALKLFTGEEEELQVQEYSGRPTMVKSQQLDMLVRVPRTFEDVVEYADALMQGAALLITFSQVDLPTRNRIFDYLNGVSYIMQASVSKVSDNMLLYAPQDVEVEKQVPRRGGWLSR